MFSRAFSLKKKKSSALHYPQPYTLYKLKFISNSKPMYKNDRIFQ